MNGSVAWWYDGGLLCRAIRVRNAFRYIGTFNILKVLTYKMNFEINFNILKVITYKMHFEMTFNIIRSLLAKCVCIPDKNNVAVRIPNTHLLLGKLPAPYVWKAAPFVGGFRKDRTASVVMEGKIRSSPTLWSRSVNTLNFAMEVGRNMFRYSTDCKRLKW